MKGLVFFLQIRNRLTGSDIHLMGPVGLSCKKHWTPPSCCFRHEHFLATPDGDEGCGWYQDSIFCVHCWVAGQRTEAPWTSHLPPLFSTCSHSFHGIIIRNKNTKRERNPPFFLTF